MIFGVLSDTHGNARLMHQAADLLCDQLGAEVLVHLGDDYDDARQLEMSGRTVWAVPGLWCAEYHGHRVPKARVETVLGWRIAFAHAERDLESVLAGVHIALTGHTHKARITWAHGAVHMNPGHLRRPTDRGEHASVGLVTLAEQSVLFTIHESDGSLRISRECLRGENGCLIPAQ